jgi:hypothetical protein
MFNGHRKRQAAVAVTVGVVVAVIVGWAWYQPVRVVVLNKAGVDLLLMEEHSSLRIAAGEQQDIGRPRGFSFLVGTEPMVGRIRFKDDGSIIYRAATLGLEKEIQPPAAWSHTGLFWREFHYGYDITGNLFLIPPSNDGALVQPEGFPLCLDRIDLSRTNSGLTSRCSRPPVAAADRGR